MKSLKVSSSGIEQRDNVLVLDDDPDFLERLTCELKSVDGLKIKAVNCARDAIESLTNNSFHLVVSDWAIHASTGPDVLSQADTLLKDLGRKIPVVFISGSDRMALTKRIKPLENFEMGWFVLKGAGTSIISQLVQSILDQRSPKTEMQ
jgi:CheY-like chemotaxis protein